MKFKTRSRTQIKLENDDDGGDVGDCHDDSHGHGDRT